MEKILQIILELITSAQYVVGLVSNFVKELKTVKEGKCHKTCKKNLLQYMAEVVGFLRQLIVMSGIKDVLKFIKPKGAKIGKIKWNPDFKDDIQTLLETVEGAMNLGKGLGKIKHPFKSNKIAMYAAAMKTTDNEKV